MAEWKKASSRRSTEAPRGARGAVLVATLLALLLLAGLVFYVFNLGRAAQQRVVAQQAADATVYAGAGTVARSYNTIARNNINIARLIAMVNVMDSVPMAVRHTRTDQEALLVSLERQLSRGVSDQWVRDALIEVQASVNDEIALLTTVDVLLNESGFDMRTVTWYDGPSGRGQFWRAMESLDVTSRATFNRLTEAAQLAAIEGGGRNLTESSPSVALMLPVVADVPIERGDFNDFEPAVGNDEHPGGLTPQALATARQNDWHHYRGPFDTIFGWRYISTHTQDWRGGASRGNVPIGAGSQGEWRTIEPDPQDYTVYGPQSWMVHRLGWFRNRHMPYSRFAYTGQLSNARSVGQTGYWMNTLSQIRRTYLWTDDDTQRVVHPEWIIDFADAAAFHARLPDSIHHTRFMIVEIKSKYPRNHPLFGSDGSWAHAEDNDQQSPRVYYGAGWLDPREWGVDKADDHIWLDEWEYYTFSDPDIGIEPTFDEDGVIQIQPVYRIDEFMFAGIDVGDEEEVDNPHNFEDRDDLPAPIDFIHRDMPIDDNTRRTHLTYLGIVQQDARAHLWPTKFDGQNPRPRFALAEARVFNNHSWDLWTPMWHVQLEPIVDYEDWLATFERDLGEARSYPNLADTDLTTMLNDLTSFQPLAEMMLEH